MLDHTFKGQVHVACPVLLNRLSCKHSLLSHQQQKPQKTTINKPQKKNRTIRCGLQYTKNYSSSIAPVGQVPAHAPHEIQVSASISNLPAPSEIAPTGQAPAHAPQLTQLSPITNAIIMSSLKSI